MKRVISCVLLMLVLTSNAFALEVPTDTVVQNLNGSQQAIKTFTVSPEQDPAALIEEPFELEGYLYTFADIVKSENPVEEKRIHTEVITVETTKDDLALILEQLKPTIEYDDGRFQGTLALDHTSLNTVAAGYATKNYTVTETKTIGQLDRNDMSYVPATTIKNGRTLSLANVEWQVTGTDLVGEALMPSQYQAVATYSAKASYADIMEELKARDEKRDAKLIRYSEAYRGLHYPVHLLSCDETGARQLQIMAVPDYRVKISKLMLRSAYRPPPEDAPAWDATYQNRPFVIGADMNLRRIDAAIASAKKRGCLPISLAALDAQGDAVLLRRYKDTGYAVIYKVTESVLTELFGHPPSLYLPPCTQYLTKKGAVVDAPLIQVDRKDRGSPRK